jgi:O-antigen/teichoic acid export membrane protein
MKNKITNFFSTSLVNKSIHVMFLRGFGVLLFFSLTLFITNNYSPELVGKIDFSRSFLLLFGTLSILGMNQSVIYYSGYLKSINEFAQLKYLYIKMLSIVFLISILLILLVFGIENSFFDQLFNKKVGQLIKKSIGCVFFYSITMLNIETFRAMDKIYISELIRNFFRYIFFFLFVILIHFYNKNEVLIDAFLINFVIIGCVSSLFILWKFSFKNSTSKNLFNRKEIMKRSIPMAVSLVILVLMQSVDILLLGKFNNFADVASYAIAVKLTIIVTLALTSVNAVFAPKIAELYSLKLFKNLKSDIIKATRLIAILTIPVILFLFVFSEYILGLFGSEYLNAKTALYILLFGQAINALCGAVGVYMNMTNRQKILQRFLLTAFLVNLVLNLILIPEYGIEGAAIATTISMILWNIGGSFYIYKNDGVRTFLN